MTQILFTQISKLLFLFVKKILKGIIQEPEWSREAEDIVQEAWKKLYEKYSHLVNEEVVARSLLFVIAKREALMFRRKRKNFYKPEHSETILLNKSYPNNIYDNIINGDVKIILASLPDNYAFVWEKVIELEPYYEQKEVIQMINPEYQEKFGEVLSIANYRTLKRRAGLKIIEILNAETV